MQQAQQIDIIGPITSWVGTKFPLICRAWGTKGGWETWAQVDFALHVKRNYPDFKLERERAVYQATDADKGTKRADFYVTSSTNNIHEQIVELKVDLQTETLLARFKTDIEKAKRRLTADYKDVQLYVMAIALTDASVHQIWTYQKNSAEQTHFSLPVSLSTGIKLGDGTYLQPVLFVWRRLV